MLFAMFVAIVIAALIVAFFIVPAFRRPTPYEKQLRRMEQARAEYRRSVEREAA